MELWGQFAGVGIFGLEDGRRKRSDYIDDLTREDDEERLAFFLTRIDAEW